MLTYARTISNLKNNLKNVAFHAGCWSIYMTYESLSIAFATGTFSKIIFYLLHYAVNILLFYAHAKIVLPAALKHRKHLLWKLPLFIVLEIAVFIACKYCSDLAISYILPEMQSGKVLLDERFIYGGIWRSIYFILLSSGYYSLINYLKERDRRELSEKNILIGQLKAKQTQIELHDTKNAFLRAQINPHFLFNTISFIYSKIHKSDPTAGKALALLSRIIRYALRSGNEPSLVKISDEMEQIKNLIALWEMRQEGGPTVFLLKIEPQLEQQKFIPLVLLTLAENMFKHGNLSHPDYPATLNIQRDETCLYIQTRNLVNTGLNDSGDHTGLQNIRKRLLLSYGPQAQIQHYALGNQYIVKIRTPLEPLPAENAFPNQNIGPQ